MDNDEKYSTADIETKDKDNRDTDNKDADNKDADNKNTGGETPDGKKSSSTARFILEAAIYILLLVMCVTVIPQYVIQRTKVDGTSMEKTLHNRDNLLVEKVTYRFHDPERFDIIVFYPYGKEEDPEDYYVKRVIGLPGETIQIKGPDIYINGTKLEENYGKDPITDEGCAIDPITLADDEFFVLGDNREVSSDSRDFGPVKKKNISGRVVMRIYPFSDFGLLTNK